jgi:hypothetical protein
MTNDALLRAALRALGIAIAVAAVIDPAVTSRRVTKPDVVVITSDSGRHESLAGDVARAIGKSYTVARGPLSGAAATIVVGRAEPPAAPLSLATPTFVVSPTGPSVEIESLVLPRAVPALARVGVTATVHVTGARGRNVDVTLRDGPVTIDHATRRVDGDESILDIPLTFIPTDTGASRLRVVARVEGGEDAVADALVDVREQKWALLFYDPHPSWMSTFVRRAIERDPRFVVTSRTVTSRGINSATGNPPVRLDDLAALSMFDAVVVGAPQAMSANDAAGLESFLRRRGGSVVLLLDEIAPGPHDRLIGIPAFAAATEPRPLALAAVGHDSLALRAASIAWPATLPVGARAITGGEHPVVWSEPVGAGTLVVSGALDAWRFRDPSSSSFDAFWRTVVADAAGAAPAPITLATRHPIVAPGERFTVEAALRETMIDGSVRDPHAVQVRATIGAGPDSGEVLHALPRAPGELTATVRAPSVPGLYQVALSADGRRASIPIMVAANPHRVVPRADAALRDWVRATGGSVVGAAEIDRLPELLARAIRIEPRLVTWHPMRSAWWILPFVLALSSEWWLRRRRGLP